MKECGRIYVNMSLLSEVKVGVLLIMSFVCLLCGRDSISKEGSWVWWKENWVLIPNLSVTNYLILNKAANFLVLNVFTFQMGMMIPVPSKTWERL